LERLVERGADLNAKCDVFGQTPLHRAAWHGRREAAEGLLSIVVDGEKSRGFLPDAINELNALNHFG
jgi:ankyrin repeat protein